MNRPRGERAGSRVALALVLGACGPSIAVVDGEPDTTGGAVEADTTMTVPSPTTSGPTIPPGSTSTHDGVDSSGASDPASTSDGEEPGCGFLCAPDAPTEACDLFAQNCPPGEKCMPWASSGFWDATRCSPLARDPGHVGETCMVEGSGVSGIDDCDVGLMCWNVDENGTGYCEDMCTGSLEQPICEDPEDFCSIANDGFIALCLTACHPLLQDCVIEGQGCYPLDAHWVCAPEGQSKGQGYPCEFINACGQGNACLGKDAFTNCAGAVGCCSTLCDRNDAAADTFCQSLDPAQTCEPWYAEGQAPVGYADVGVCMIAGTL